MMIFTANLIYTDPTVASWLKIDENFANHILKTEAKNKFLVVLQRTRLGLQSISKLVRPRHCDPILKNSASFHSCLDHCELCPKKLKY